MTSPIRIVTALALPLLAAAIGYLLTSPPANSGLDQRLAAWPDISPPADYSNSVDRIIGEISNMYLFGRDPAAIAASISQMDDSGLPQNDELNRISLFAIITRDGQPAGVVEDSNLGVLSVGEGEQIADSWTVTSISKDHLVVTRDGEFRTLSLLSAISDDQ